jgi:hypothetical protein
MPRGSARVQYLAVVMAAANPDEEVVAARPTNSEEVAAARPTNSEEVAAARPANSEEVEADPQDGDHAYYEGGQIESPFVVLEPLLHAQNPFPASSGEKSIHRYRLQYFRHQSQPADGSRCLARDQLAELQ